MRREKPKKCLCKSYKNKALKISDGYVYYFNNDDVWCKQEMKAGCEYTVNLPVPVEYWNESKQKKALDKLQVGNTFKQFRELYESDERSLPKGLDRFIGRVEVIMERESDNANPNTFDFVRVFAYTTYEPEGGKRNFIKQHVADIKQYVIEKIEADKDFQQYKVPICFLKLANITITTHNDIVLIFELKSQTEDKL